MVLTEDEVRIVELASLEKCVGGIEKLYISGAPTKTFADEALLSTSGTQPLVQL